MFSYRPKRPDRLWAPPYSVDTAALSPWVKQTRPRSRPPTTHLSSRLRMIGSIPLHPYALIAWGGTTFINSFSYDTKDGICGHARVRVVSVLSGIGLERSAALEKSSSPIMSNT
jgi:hypothetical protein